MFQINSMLLRKMGWADHSSPTFNSPRFDDNDLVRFYIRPSTIYFFIKDISEEEKQKSKNSYKFVYNKREIEFKSNMELLRLINENEACNEEYKRHFKLNKLLR
jgi:hypothetical protein